MESKQFPGERRWKNDIVLLLGSCMACPRSAPIRVRVLPSTREWAGIDVPMVIGNDRFRGGESWVSLRSQSGSHEQVMIASRVLRVLWVR